MNKISKEDLCTPSSAVRYYYDRSYPPDDYYDFEQNDRVWVPGHWEHRRHVTVGKESGCLAIGNGDRINKKI